MARRKRIMVFAFAAVAVLALIFWAAAQWTQPDDPLYGGVPLSAHLFTIYGPRPNPSQKQVALWQADAQKRNASRTVLFSVKPGREALPLITNWLATDSVAWKLKVGERLRKYGADYLNLSVDRRLIAWRFLSEFPIGAGNELLPYIEKALTITNRSDLMPVALALTRNFDGAKNVDIDQALKVLIPLKYKLSEGSRVGLNPSFSWNHGIDVMIETLDPQRLLRPVYILEIGHIPERVGAAMELADFPRLPERVVPLLVRNLGSTNRSVQEQCAITLGKYGEKARTALPALTNLLQHPRDRVRMAASNALATIKAANK